MSKTDEKIDALKKEIDALNSKLESKSNLDFIQPVFSSLYETIRDQLNKHSIAQELIDEGAFDVAKSYIDFLKEKKNKDYQGEVVVKAIKTVSPIGKKTMKKNNSADFGPDTKGTKTSGFCE